jgi:uncharacterized cofD-like protein
MTKGLRRRFWLGLWRWFVPGIHVKRYVLMMMIGLVVLVLAFVGWARVGPERNFFINLTARFIEFSEAIGFGRWGLMGLVFGGGLTLGVYGVIGLNRSLLAAIGSSPSDTLNTIFTQRALGRGPRIVALGGGTGLSNLLSGLKRYSSNITAIVAVTDDGGSSGRLREALEMPAPGDMTDCYAALSDSPLLSDLLTHRFTRGDIKGHTFGNLLIATLAEHRQNFAEATLAINQILNVRGRVLPASLEPSVLVTRLEDGTEIRGESHLREETAGRRIERVRLEPSDAHAPDAALEAIEHAELIVIGPGSLFTSVMPPLLVPAIARAIGSTRAPVVYVCNIMSEPGETDHLTVTEHAKAVAKHLGRLPDAVLVNTAKLKPGVLERYQSVQSTPVQLDFEALDREGMTALQADLGSSAQHDARRLAWALMRFALTKRLRRPSSLYFKKREA